MVSSSGIVEPKVKMKKDTYDAYPDGWTCIACGEEFQNVLPASILDGEGTICDVCLEKEE